MGGGAAVHGFERGSAGQLPLLKENIKIFYFE